MKTVSEILEYEIYPNLDRGEVIRELNPQDKGEYYLCNCPRCHEREAYIYKNGYKIACNRQDKCGYEEHIWNYETKTKGLTGKETIMELARCAGIHLSDDHKSNIGEIEKRQMRADTIETFLNICMEELGKSAEAQTYLKGRGFSFEDAHLLGIGFCPSINTIRDRVPNIEKVGGFIEENNINVWANRIVAVCRDRAGRAESVWGRTISEGVKPKYFNLQGKQYTPFGLDTCSQKHIIAVEGGMDVLTLRKNGYMNIVALSRNTISEEYLKSLVREKTTTVTLIPDNDKAGYDGLRGTMEKLEANDIRVYLVDPREMGAKDADEYIRKYGKEAFGEVLNKAQRGEGWLIKRLIEKNDVSTDKGRDTALSEGVAILNKVRDSVRHDYARNELASVLSLPVGIIDELCVKARKSQAEEQLRCSYLKLLNEAQKEMVKGNIGAVEELFNREVPKLKIKTVTPVEYFSYERLMEEGKIYGQGGKKTGIDDLDRAVKMLPQELVIIGGRSRHGKSDFAYNILLNFLEKNPEETFVFFNHELAMPIMMSRLATIKAKKSSGESFAYKENVLPSFQIGAFKPEIYDAFQFFKKCGEEKCLVVVSKPDYSVEQIVEYCGNIKQDRKIGAIFLDYVELAKTSSKYEIEEQRISHIVNTLRAASQQLGVLVIALAQINRASVTGKNIANRRPQLEGLRYSGRQEQEATTVLGLFNYSAEKVGIALEEGESIESERETTLEIIPLKNRGGQSNKPILLNYDMVSGYISSRQG